MSFCNGVPMWKGKTSFYTDLSPEIHTSMCPPGANRFFQGNQIHNRSLGPNWWLPWVLCRYLSEEEAIGDLPKQFQDYARVAWRFLDSLGYINFGVSPGILSKAKSFPKDKGNVVIIGAGLAGKSFPMVSNQPEHSFQNVLGLMRWFGDYQPSSYL